MLLRHTCCVLSRVCCNEHSLLLNSHLYKIGRTKNCSCSGCGHTTQETSHLILHSPAINSLRHWLFGNSLSLYDLWGVVRFMRIHALPPNPLTSKGVGQSTTTAMRKRPGKSTNGRCWPSVLIFLHLNIKSQRARKICVASQLITRKKTLCHSSTRDTLY